MSDPIRDCPHGHMKGKCDTCELIVAEARIAELEFLLHRARATTTDAALGRDIDKLLREGKK